MIFCDLFRYVVLKNNVVEIVHKIYTLHIRILLIKDIANHSAGLIMSYHMFDAVIRGMVGPPDNVAYTNTITVVLCISDTLL